MSQWAAEKEREKDRSGPGACRAGKRDGGCQLPIDKLDVYDNGSDETLMFVRNR